MGRKRDQFWDYAEQRLDGRFKCNFCHGDFPGGATRIKAHLAGVLKKFKKKPGQLKRLTKSLNVHHSQAVLGRVQLHHQKLWIELSHRCLFSPNIVVYF